MTIPSTGQHQQFNALFLTKNNFRLPAAVSRDTAFQTLDDIGAESVLEHIASGCLPAEIAIALSLPHMYVQEWVEARLDKRRLKIAYKGFAEVAVLKSHLTLAITPDNPQEALAMRATSEQLTWMAERVDSERWGPPKKADAPPPPVTITLNIPTIPKLPESAVRRVAAEMSKVIEHAPVSTR